jgi:hypothetical protein
MPVARPDGSGHIVKQGKTEKSNPQKHDSSAPDGKKK